MSSFEFFTQLNIPLYLICLLFSFFLYCLVYTRQYIGIFDPFTYYLFFSMFAFTTSVYLYIDGFVSEELFIHFILTQLFFFIGFSIPKPIDITRKKYQPPNIFIIKGIELRAIKWFFILFSSLTVLLQVKVYIEHGFPIFSESRLDFVGDDVFSKLLLRINDIVFASLVSISFVIIYVFPKRFTISMRRISYLFLVFLITCAVLNGSKSAIIKYLLLFALFAYVFNYIGVRNPKKVLKKYGIWIFGISILGALSIVIIAGEAENAGKLLLYRLVMSGDVFYMAYPNNVIDRFIDSNAWYVSLFASPAKMFNLIDIQDVPSVLGFDLMSYHEGYDLSKGPNPRHNVLGYVYIGYYGSIAFSFILGLTVSFLRNSSFSFLSRNTLGIILYINLVLISIKAEADYFNFLAGIINFFVLIILWSGCWLLSYASRKYKI
jgi:hypothetical protein